jgi:transcriptional regulator with XRE-family HTH domain
MGAGWIATDGRREVAVAAELGNDILGGHGEDTIAISEKAQRLFRLSRYGPAPLYSAAVPINRDQTPEASAIKAAQKARLRALREILDPVQSNAARRSGVSVPSWNRMEVGDTEVSAVALARFCAAYGVPAEWVITGGLAGLRPEIVLVLAREHPELIAGAGESSAGPSNPSPVGSLGSTSSSPAPNTRMAPTRQKP